VDTATSSSGTSKLGDQDGGNEFVVRAALFDLDRIVSADTLERFLKYVPL
jgi:hypothetical protein